MGFEMTCAFGVEMNALQSRYVFGKNCRTFFVFNDTPLPLLIKKKKKMKILFLDGHAKKWNDNGDILTFRNAFGLESLAALIERANAPIDGRTKRFLLCRRAPLDVVV